MCLMCFIAVSGVGLGLSEQFAGFTCVLIFDGFKTSWYDMCGHYINNTTLIVWNILIYTMIYVLLFVQMTLTCSYVNYFGEVWISSDCHVLSRFKGKPNTMETINLEYL